MGRAEAVIGRIPLPSIVLRVEEEEIHAARRGVRRQQFRQVQQHRHAARAVVRADQGAGGQPRVRVAVAAGAGVVVRGDPEPRSSRRSRRDHVIADFEPTVAVGIVQREADRRAGEPERVGVGADQAPQTRAAPAIRDDAARKRTGRAARTWRGRPRRRGPVRARAARRARRGRAGRTPPAAAAPPRRSHAARRHRRPKKPQKTNVASRPRPKVMSLVLVSSTLLRENTNRSAPERFRVTW